MSCTVPEHMDTSSLSSILFVIQENFEIFLQPATYAALGTLIVLEVVLGIDNLVFIAILAEKLPPEDRSKARAIGLSLALLTRFLLLSVMAFLIHLNSPLFTLFGHAFSARDIIMLAGGLFLLYKATTELHERLDGDMQNMGGVKNYAGFWVVVAQIILLDAVFSIDSVLTAVGMVDHLAIMLVAVTVAMGIMFLASKPLMDFVSRHPTIVVLCLSFLLLIGLSLLAESMGYGIPKGYLYAAIGFSMIIEFFNQLAQRNLSRSEKRKSFRTRTAQAVMNLLGAMEIQPEGVAVNHEHGSASNTEHGSYATEEVNIVSRVLMLSERTVRSIMTHRSEAEFIDLDESIAMLGEKLLNGMPSLVPVCRGSLDNVVGMGRSVDLLADIIRNGAISEEKLAEPIIVPETMRVMKLLELLKSSAVHFVLVADEYGAIEGIITAMDIYEAMAGELPTEGEAPAVQEKGDGSMIIAGHTDVHLIEGLLEIPGLVSESNDYTSFAGFMLASLDRLPEIGDSIEHEGYRFTVEEISERRISAIRVEKLASK